MGKFGSIKLIVDSVEKISSLMEILWSDSGSVIVNRRGITIVSNDPVSIILDINDENDTGVKILKNICREVGVNYGNDFCLFVMILSSVLKKGFSYISAGVVPKDFLANLRDDLEKISKSVSDESTEDFVLSEVLKTKFDNENLINKVVLAFSTTGKSGNIVVECGKGVDTECIFRDGIEVPFGISRSLDLSEVTLDQPIIATVNSGMSSFDDVRTILEEGSELDRPIVIISRYSEGDAVATWNLNKKIGNHEWVFVDMSGVDSLDWMEDIASVSGSTVVNKSAGLDHKNFKKEWFGSVQSLSLDKKKSSFVCYGEAPESMYKRIDDLRYQASVSDKNYVRDRLLERASRLDGGYCVIRVGGYTSADSKYNRSVVERMISTSNSCLKSGVFKWSDINFGGLSTIRDEMSTIKRISKEGVIIPVSSFNSILERVYSLSSEILSSGFVFFS